jgi:hypothetical protein
MSLPNDSVMKEARISIKLLCVGKGNKGEEDKWKELAHFQDLKEDPLPNYQKPKNRN